jgi:hypothetical protein
VKALKKLAFGIVLALTLSIFSGCSVLSKAEKGNYIISKEGHNILVANEITLKAAKSKSFTELKKSNIDIISYIIEDSQLYNELVVGEKVIVTPKSSNGLIVVMQSDPPQIVADDITRLNNLVLTEKNKSTYRTIAWNAMEASEKKLVIKDWNKAEVSIITYKDQGLIPYKAESVNKKLKNHELITVTFNTKLDPMSGPIVVVINPETNLVVGFYTRY